MSWPATETYREECERVEDELQSARDERAEEINYKIERNQDERPTKMGSKGKKNLGQQKNN